MEKYTVFISSTIDDLRAERVAVELAILPLEIFSVVRVENLPASELDSNHLCLKELREADVLVLLIGPRYGYIPPRDNPENLSVTHLEFRESRKLKLPIFAFRLPGEYEDRSLAFLKEVEDFSEGVFRKSCRSVQQLIEEVPRSLLWWLAREARRNDQTRSKNDALRAQIQSRGLASLPSSLENLSQKEAVAEWIKGAYKALTAYSEENLLPSPVSAVAPTDALLCVRVSDAETPEHVRVEIHGEISAEKEPAEETAHPFGLTIELTLSSAGQNTLAALIEAFLYVKAEDPNMAVNRLSAAYSTEGLSDESRAPVLAAMADLSLRFDLEEVLHVAKEALRLETVSPKVLTQLEIATLITCRKFAIRGSRNAERQAEHLYFQQLLKDLQTNQSGPETIYSVARKLLLGDFSKTGLRLYTELIKIHPYYEQRWYWHRDLGLYYYSRHEYESAAHHYDVARYLKPESALLHRFAGDAYYYRGNLGYALERYEKAVTIEPTEIYYVDSKIFFCRMKIRSGISIERIGGARKQLAHGLSRVGAGLADRNYHCLAAKFFRLACQIYRLDYESSRWLAVYANRRGDYDEAIMYLTNNLFRQPENPFTRLNLAADLIFRNNGKTDACKSHLRAAIFHGGPQTRDRFSVLLSNTKNREDLLKEFDLLFSKTKREWEEAQKRRLETVKPEQFGGVTHIEL